MVPLFLVLSFVGFVFYESKKFESECKQRENEIRQRIKNSPNPSEECSKIFDEMRGKSEEINRQWNESQKKQEGQKINSGDVALGWLLAKWLK
jgi:hypothetical protein